MCWRTRCGRGVGFIVLTYLTVTKEQPQAAHRTASQITLLLMSTLTAEAVAQFQGKAGRLKRTGEILTGNTVDALQGLSDSAAVSVSRAKNATSPAIGFVSIYRGPGTYRRPQFCVVSQRSFWRRVWPRCPCSNRDPQIDIVLVSSHTTNSFFFRVDGRRNAGLVRKRFGRRDVQALGVSKQLRVVMYREQAAEPELSVHRPQRPVKV